MKVFVIGPNPKDPTRNGGVAKYIEYLKLIPARPEQGPDKFIYKGTDVVWMSKLGLKSLGRLLATLWIAVQLLFSSRQETFVHLNVTLSKGGGLRVLPILMVCRLKKVGVLTQIHGGRWNQIKNSRLFSSTWLFIFKQSKSVGCFSGPQYKELVELPQVRNKLVKLINFVPSVFKYDKSKEPFVFLFLGRLLKEKGVMDIVAAIDLINKSFGDKEFIVNIVGDGPELEKLRTFNVANLRVLGRKSGQQLHNLLSEANVLLLPSYYPEGFPLVFLEAASHGLAPIVTDNSAVVDYFEEGKEYIGVQPKAPAELAEKMLHFIRDKQAATNMGECLKKKVEKEFSATSDRVFNQYNDIYMQSF